MKSYHSRAGFLICCYLMDRKELDIEKAISLFDQLAGPDADPTKDMYKEALRNRHELVNGFLEAELQKSIKCKYVNCKVLLTSLKDTPRTIPCKYGPNCMFLNQPCGCRC